MLPMRRSSFPLARQTDTACPLPIRSPRVSSPRPKPPRTLFLLLTYEFSARSAPSVSLPFPRISAALGSDGEGKRMCPGRVMRPASERITKASPPARRMGPALRFGGSFQYWMLKGLSYFSPRRVGGGEVQPPGSERLPFRDPFPAQTASEQRHPSPNSAITRSEKNCISSLGVWKPKAGNSSWEMLRR